MPFMPSSDGAWERTKVIVAVMKKRKIWMDRWNRIPGTDVMCTDLTPE